MDDRQSRIKMLSHLSRPYIKKNFGEWICVNSFSQFALYLFMPNC